MIDEKKLIELCKELKEKETGAFSKGYNKALRDIVSTIKSNSFPKVSEWIPVSERLPEKLDDLKNEDNFMKSMYLVTDGQGVVVSLFDGVFRDMTHFTKYNDVLAWQPLPEPYRKDVE